MHTIDTSKTNLRTDLVLDFDIKSNKILSVDGVSLYNSKKDNFNYSTITFIDCTDRNMITNIETILINELKRYIKKNTKVLIVGLGNRKSTPDALGPKVLDSILVTRHLFSLGDVESNYSNVSILEPNVFGSTGISSIDMIKQIVDIVKPDYCILIDSLCTSNSSRLNKTIQITDKGINPGSGVYNDRGELSENTLNCKTIAIGVPTVIDIDALISSKIIDKTKSIEIEDNLIVTPKEIDFIIDNLSYIIATSINKVLHNINRQETSKI